MYQEVKEIIEQAWENRDLLKEERVKQSIRQVIEWLDKGKSVRQNRWPMAHGK